MHWKQTWKPLKKLHANYVCVILEVLSLLISLI